jgi:hypothetical protein
LAILTNTRDIAVWTLFPVVFISLGMSPFLRLYSPFLPVYHQMSPILPCLPVVVILLIQHNYFTNSPCQHPLPRQLSHHLPRHPPNFLLLPRHHQALPRHLAPPRHHPAPPRRHQALLQHHSALSRCNPVLPCHLLLPRHTLRCLSFPLRPTPLHHHHLMLFLFPSPQTITLSALVQNLVFVFLLNI